MSELNRFYEAQEEGYPRALSEIKNGMKVSHWMWYIFPQITGLGYSSTAQYYAIKDLEEANEYLNDEVLGNRLREISLELLKIETNIPSKANKTLLIIFSIEKNVLFAIKK